MRTHVSLPKDVVDEIDAIAGPRKRSEFIEQAMRLKLINERQKRALAGFEGLKGDYPDWRTPQDVSRWVGEGRERDNQRLEELLRRFSQ